MAKQQVLTTFLWEGSNQQGSNVKGEISAENLIFAKAKLREQHITVKKIYKKPQPLFGERKQKIKTGDISYFTRQLATMLKAGIPLVQALEIVGRGTTNNSVKALIQTIRVDVEGGLTFSDALAKHKKIFGGLFVNLVMAGEKSGSLDTMLVRLAEYLEKHERIRKKIKKAMTYPAIVIIIALLISAGLLIFIVPQFAQVFASFGAELPLPTRIVVNLSKIVGKYWWIILGLIVGGVFAFKAAKKKSKKFADNVERFSLKLPIMGNILKKAAVARFARTLSTTFAAGLPLIEALQSVAGATGNAVFRDATLAIREEVSSGQRMQQAMQDMGVFPAMVVQMVGIGEEAGSLDFMLTKVADIYEEDVDNAVDNLSTLMEPIIMVILGVLIGGLVVAMYMPIFKLGSVI